MISIIVVYNNKETFQTILLQSLIKQSVDYELIAIDNTNSQFKSAAAALNYGADTATGEYLMFIHQDIKLQTHSWLKDTEVILNTIPALGIAGVVGMSDTGKNFVTRWRGYIWDGHRIPHWSKKKNIFEKVQTLDECMLIIPKRIFNSLKFDSETFDGWHCYGIDYCLAVKDKLDLDSYVIPMFVFHLSTNTNIKNLFTYQKRLLNKHERTVSRIYTTCGTISLMNLSYLWIKNILIQLPILRICYLHLKERPKFFP
jgi:glycosyltransferase involved in cell wall biosynthesis